MSNRTDVVFWCLSNNVILIISVILFFSVVVAMAHCSAYDLLSFCWSLWLRINAYSTQCT